MARSGGGVDEVLDAGVGAGGDAELDGELEVGVDAGREDVADVAALVATVLGDGGEAVFDLPPGQGSRELRIRPLRIPLHTTQS